MRIIGIDPGTITTGYGVIEGEEEDAKLIDYGVITSPRGTPLAKRLCHLYQELQQLLQRYLPQEVAIEEPFVAKNMRSALAVGQAQAVAILAASLREIPVYAYTPTQVKRTVADYGGSNKEQVQQMVKLQLGLLSSPQPSDAADALAVALCHLQHTHLTKILKSSPDLYPPDPPLPIRGRGMARKRGEASLNYGLTTMPNPEADSIVSIS